MLRLSSLPPVTTTLVVVNILIFVYGTLSNTQNAMISQYGFVPNGLFKDGYIGDSIVRMFTSMFVHANISHVGFNMFALAYMGGFVERS
ncbi:MAG: rhomboid family intramembrane serine protease, partial [Nitrosotalea sp.]